jgi:hypothetical protein
MYFYDSNLKNLFYFWYLNSPMGPDYANNYSDFLVCGTCTEMPEIW